jgi:hypothetical protein
MTFSLDDYVNLPRAVRFAYRRKEQDCTRLEAEVEWLRLKLLDMEKDSTTLKAAVEAYAALVPFAYSEALERAARLAPPELADQIRSITCNYR